MNGIEKRIEEIFTEHCHNNTGIKDTWYQLWIIEQTIIGTSLACEDLHSVIKMLSEKLEIDPESVLKMWDEWKKDNEKRHV